MVAAQSEPMGDVTGNPGRPTKFSKHVGEQICERLIGGSSLREICSSEDMPDKATVCRWLAKNDKFRDQYARARNMQAEMMADEILDIADDTSGDVIEGNDGSYGNPAAVQRSKLRVDARKWIASKILPKKYGDRPQEESGNKPNEQLEALVAALNAGGVPPGEVNG